MDTLLLTSTEVLVPAHSEQFVSAEDRRRSDLLVLSLSPAQKEVLNKTSYGYSTREIASDLFRAFGTIKNHREAILDNLISKNMVEAVDVGFEVGMLKLDTGDNDEQNQPRVTAIEAYELILAAQGLTCAQASKERQVSPITVRNERVSLMHKLGATNMAHAVRLAREAGIPTRANALPVAEPKTLLRTLS